MASAQGFFSLEIHWFTTTRGKKTLVFFCNFRRKDKTIGSTELLLTLVYLRQGGDDVEAYLTLNRERGVVTGSVTTEGTAVYLVEQHPKYGQVVLKKRAELSNGQKPRITFCATWCKVWITTDDSLNLGGPDDTLEDVSFVLFIFWT